MANHVIKFDYKDEKKLSSPVVWCGEEVTKYDIAFVDAHHVALAVGGSTQPCKECIKAIISELEKEL